MKVIRVVDLAVIGDSLLYNSVSGSLIKGFDFHTKSIFKTSETKEKTSADFFLELLDDDDDIRGQRIADTLIYTATGLILNERPLTIFDTYETFINSFSLFNTDTSFTDIGEATAFSAQFIESYFSFFSFQIGTEVDFKT